jgi:hypothetical protein
MLEMARREFWKTQRLGAAKPQPKTEQWRMREEGTTDYSDFTGLQNFPDPFRSLFSIREIREIL